MSSPEGGKVSIWAYFDATWRRNYTYELDDFCGGARHLPGRKITILRLALTLAVFECRRPQKPKNRVVLSTIATAIKIDFPPYFTALKGP